MALLDEGEIWQRIKKLENKVIRTIEKGRVNKILFVSNSDITIEGRKTKPTREDVKIYWQILTNDGMITKENRPEFGWSGGHKTGRIVMAILATALPDYIEAFPRHNPYVRGLSGIRLKRT
jgi:hypothetical protein